MLGFSLKKSGDEGESVPNTPDGSGMSCGYELVKQGIPTADSRKTREDLAEQLRAVVSTSVQQGRDLQMKEENVLCKK